MSKLLLEQRKNQLLALPSPESSTLSRSFTQESRSHLESASSSCCPPTSSHFPEPPSPLDQSTLRKSKRFVQLRRTFHSSSSSADVLASFSGPWLFSSSWLV